MMNDNFEDEIDSFESNRIDRNRRVFHLQFPMVVVWRNVDQWNAETAALYKSLNLIDINVKIKSKLFCLGRYRLTVLVFSYRLSLAR